MQYNLSIGKPLGHAMSEGVSLFSEAEVACESKGYSGRKRI